MSLYPSSTWCPVQAPSSPIASSSSPPLVPSLSASPPPPSLIRLFVLVGSTVLLFLHAEAQLTFNQITDAANWDVRSELYVHLITTPHTMYTANQEVIDVEEGWQVMYGGLGLGSILYNDSWVSGDGANWTIVGGTDIEPPYSSVTQSVPYVMFPSTALCSSETTLVIVSGHTEPAYYETSQDDSQTWSFFNNQIFGPRTSAACVIDPQSGSLIVMGGLLMSGNFSTVSNDVWQVYPPFDGTSTWNQLTDRASWHARDGLVSAAYYNNKLNKTIIYIIGGSPENHGYAYGVFNASNDVYISSDLGSNWLQLTAAAPFSPRALGFLSVTDDGILILTGGDNGGDVLVYPHDIWLSLDGITWGQCANASNLAYSARRNQGVMLDNKNYLWIYGGEEYSSAGSAGKFNDVYRSNQIVSSTHGAQLAEACGIPNCAVGLQCWPTQDGTCPCVVPPEPSSSSSSSSPSLSSSSPPSSSSSSSRPPSSSTGASYISSSSMMTIISGSTGSTSSSSTISLISSTLQSSGDSAQTSSSGTSSNSSGFFSLGSSGLDNSSTNSMPVGYSSGSSAINPILSNGSSSGVSLAVNGGSEGNSSSSALSAGAIVGIVIGVLVLCCLLLTTAFCVQKKQRHSSRFMQTTGNGHAPDQNGVEPHLFLHNLSRLPWGFLPGELSTPNGSVHQSGIVLTSSESESRASSSSYEQNNQTLSSGTFDSVVYVYPTKPNDTMSSAANSDSSVSSTEQLSPEVVSYRYTSKIDGTDSGINYISNTNDRSYAMTDNVVYIH